MSHARIINALKNSNCAMTAKEIARNAGMEISEVQPMLHKLDDAGRVIMRGGWYRVSESEKAGKP
jgi:DNA-binding IclR family transcriptional regulator